MPSVAIVGAGLMGRWHAYYARRAGARVVAVVDKNLSAAEALARRTGAAALSADSDWLGQSGPDWVHVCTPLGTHEEVTRAALMRDCHVIVEKPVADTRRAAEALAELAARRGRLVVAVHQFPFQRGVRRLVRELPSLGRIQRVEFATQTAGAEGRDPGERQLVALEIMPHALSLFSAVGYRVEPEQYRAIEFSARALELDATASETRLRIRVDLCSRPTFNEFRLHAERGSAVADLFHGYLTIDRAKLGRTSKILRPFRTASSTLWLASSNLMGRALRREAAYPGLRELIAASYAQAGEARAPIPVRDFVDAAALSERLRAEAQEPSY